jgi:hypothetical protein
MGSSEYDEEDIDDLGMSETDSKENSPVKPASADQKHAAATTVCASLDSTLSPSKDVLSSLTQQMEGRVIAHIDMVGRRIRSY